MSFDSGGTNLAGTFVTPSGGGIPTGGGGGGGVATGGGGGGGGGGGMPSTDWASLIANSPYVLAANALAAQQLSALRAQMGSSAARALVRLGDASLADSVGDLDLPGGVGKEVQQANDAGTSIIAQLGHQHGLNTQSIPASLAGRGFYRSGQTGYALGEENRKYGQQQYDARQSTLDYLNGLYSNFLNSQFGIQQGQLSAEMQAYQSALSQISMLAGIGTQPNVSLPGPAGSTAAADYGAQRINNTAGLGLFYNA